MQGAWHSPNTLHTMVYCQVYQLVNVKKKKKGGWVKCIKYRKLFKRKKLIL